MTTSDHAKRAPLDIGAELRRMSAMLRRDSVAVVLIIAGCLLIGLASILFMPRVYEAVASVQIDPPAGKLLSTTDDKPTVSGGNAERFLGTQVDVLNSRAMAKRVAKRLDLNTSDDFLTATGDSSLGQPNAANREEEVLDALTENLRIDLRPNSRVVGIRFSGRDPDIAAHVANTYAQEFIEANVQRMFSTGDYARAFLQNQLGLAKDRLEASERALNSYTRASGMIDLSNGAAPGGGAPRSLASANLLQLSHALADAKAARIAAQQRWELARDVQPTTLPEVLSNLAMQQLLQQHATLDADLSEMRQHLKADHPSVIRASAQLNELDRQTRSLGENIRSSIRNEYLASQRQERAIGDQVETLKSATRSEQDLGVRYNLLRREVDTNRQMYDSVLGRFKDLSTQAGVATNNITVVDTADVPRRPISPRPWLNLALALAAGVILALVYVYGREKLDDVIRDPRDVVSKLRLPLLGVVPEFAGGNLQEALDRPGSELAEAYALVRSAVELSSNKGLPSSLLVTSSAKGEGKSTTAYVLASDLTRIGRKVLLIDADTSRSSPNHLFDVPLEAAGLSSVLARLLPASKAIRPAASGGPAFMPSGPPPPDLANLFAGTAVRELLTELSSAYDMVVVDGPPVTGAEDAAELAAAVEATVFVVEAGTAHFGQARSAASRMARAGANLIGCVVTKYHTRKVGFTGDGHDYDYG